MKTKTDKEIQELRLKYFRLVGEKEAIEAILVEMKRRLQGKIYEIDRLVETELYREAS